MMEFATEAQLEDVIWRSFWKLYESGRIPITPMPKQWKRTKADIWRQLTIPFGDGQTGRADLVLFEAWEDTEARPRVRCVVIELKNQPLRAADAAQVLRYADHLEGILTMELTGRIPDESPEVAEKLLGRLYCEDPQPPRSLRLVSGE